MSNAFILSSGFLYPINRTKIVCLNYLHSRWHIGEKIIIRSKIMLLRNKVFGQMIHLVILKRTCYWLLSPQYFGNTFQRKREILWFRVYLWQVRLSICALHKLCSKFCFQSFFTLADGKLKNINKCSITSRNIFASIAHFSQRDLEMI